MVRPAPISSIRSHVELFFSLVADIEGSCDADALANALPHRVQNEVLAGLAAPQCLQYLSSPICVSTPFDGKYQPLGSHSCFE
jgi:hypothetical protein